MLVGTDNVELVAMADVFEDKLESSLKRLRAGDGLKRYAGTTVKRDGKAKTWTEEDLMKEIPGRVQVAPENHFVGFEAYKKVINSGVDIVMLTTPPGYRPLHFEAAIQAGKHVFTEKPIATDPVGCRRFMAAAKLASEKKLSVVSGAQRHAQVVLSADSGEDQERRYWRDSFAVFHTTCPGPCSMCRRAMRSGPIWNGSTATGTASCGSAAIRLWSSTSTTSTSSAG